jgi:hypothetical protein
MDHGYPEPLLNWVIPKAARTPIEVRGPANIPALPWHQILGERPKIGGGETVQLPRYHCSQLEARYRTISVRAKSMDLDRSCGRTIRKYAAKKVRSREESCP